MTVIIIPLCRYNNAVELQNLINHELSKVKEWCDLNKLSINLKKTNI